MDAQRYKMASVEREIK